MKANTFPLLIAAAVFMLIGGGCSQQQPVPTQPSKAGKQGNHPKRPGTRANGGVISFGSSAIVPTPSGLTGKLQVVYKDSGQASTHKSTWAKKAASSTGSYGSSIDVDSAAVVVNTGSLSTDYLVWITPSPGDTFSPQPVKVTVPCHQLIVLTINYP
jgi:hypothetical protein